MNIDTIREVGVVGGGVMGGGIAQTLALAGYKVVLRDISNELIEKTRNTVINSRFGLKSGVERGKLSQEQMDKAVANLKFTTRLEDMKNCDLIIEAVPENMELKRKVFGELDATVKKEAIFTSNSSNLTHTEISRDLKRKDRYLGMHWFSPANVMKVVEIVYTPTVTEDVIKTIEVLCQRLGKTSVRVKDVPGDTGYINNRIFHALQKEAQKIVDEGIATEEDIDTAMKLGRNWPSGPFDSRKGTRSGWV